MSQQEQFTAAAHRHARSLTKVLAAITWSVPSHGTLHGCCMHLFQVTQASKAAQGMQMQLVPEVLACMHETVLQAVFKCKAMRKLWVSAGALWCAECRQFWRESVSQAYLHLGSGSRQHSARVAQAPARLPVLSAHHQPARQCAGDHVVHCPHGSEVPAFANLACSTCASVYAFLSLLGLLVGPLQIAGYPSLYSTAAEEQA